MAYRRDFLWIIKHLASGLSDVSLTMDHVIPLSRGGDHSIDNIVPSCFSCNASKGNKLLSEISNNKSLLITARLAAVAAQQR